jgi:hypothetical protein
MKHILYAIFFLSSFLVQGQKDKGFETPAEFQGGNVAMNEWIKRMQASIVLNRFDHQPYINYELTIDKNGKVSKVECLYRLPNQNDLLYMNALYKMPKWKAATRNGRNISSKIRIKVMCTGNEW